MNDDQVAAHHREQVDQELRRLTAQLMAETARINAKPGWLSLLQGVCLAWTLLATGAAGAIVLDAVTESDCTETCRPKLRASGAGGED